MKPIRLAGLLGLAATLVSSAPALAHSIESSLERLSSLNDSLQRGSSSSATAPETLRLESQFSSGQPTGDAVVRLVPPGGGSPIELGRTDAAGHIDFTLPPRADSHWEVQVDAGPGHRDYLELPQATNRAAAAAPVSRSHP